MPIISNFPTRPVPGSPFPLTEEGEQQAADCVQLLRQHAQTWILK